VNAADWTPFNAKYVQYAIYIDSSSLPLLTWATVIYLLERRVVETSILPVAAGLHSSTVSPNLLVPNLEKKSNYLNASKL